MRSKQIRLNTKDALTFKHFSKTSVTKIDLEKSWDKLIFNGKCIMYMYQVYAWFLGGMKYTTEQWIFYNIFFIKKLYSWFGKSFTVC